MGEGWVNGIVVRSQHITVRKAFSAIPSASLLSPLLVFVRFLGLSASLPPSVKWEVESLHGL